MIYCFDKRLPFDYSKTEMALAKKAGNGILYDDELGIFTDFSGNKVDIKGKTLFTRTGVAQIYDMNNSILKNGGKLRANNQEIDKMLEWSKHYKTKRKIEIYSGSDLINSETINEIEKKFGEFVFFKTMEKNFSSIIPISLLKDDKCVFYKALLYHLKDKFIISEPVKIISDEYGLKEYRCFVINNEAYSISRFTTQVFHQIDVSVLDKLQEIISSMKGTFSSDYVVDLMEYESNQEKYIDVVEFNSIYSSGPFLYNSILEKSEDILHTKNIRNISKEFIANINNCSMKGKMINERGNLYDIKDGFSSDLKSIYITGDRGVIFFEDWELTVENFAKNVEQLEWEPIESDEELLNKCSEEDQFQEFTNLRLTEQQAKEYTLSLSKLLNEQRKK